jgi:16S rRNA (adenine1518-N6/adenine1519-N6)-dimethyltransferase
VPFFVKSELLAILERLGIHLDKTRGQCYLVDRNIVNIILQNADLDPQNDIVAEIGSGLGTLSDFLIEGSKRTFLIETDKKIVNFLKEHFETMYPIYFESNCNSSCPALDRENKKIVILHQDVLKTPFPSVNKIIGNIPYQISAPIIFKLIEEWNFKKVILMVQQEFADRLTAPLNSSKYSRLSAATNLFLEVKKLHKVSPSCFYPEPQVTSSIIEITAKPDLQSGSPQYRFRKEYLQFLAGIFPYKNKNLAKALGFFEKQISLSKDFNIPKLKKTSIYQKFGEQKLRSVPSNALFEMMRASLGNKE